MIVVSKNKTENRPQETEVKWYGVQFLSLLSPLLIYLDKNDLIPNFIDLLTKNCYKCVVIFNI